MTEHSAKSPCPVKYHVIIMDLAGLELGASYYRHRGRLGVGQKNGAELAPGVVVTDGVVMIPSRSLAVETYLLTISAAVEAAMAVEEAGGQLKRQPKIMLGEAIFRPIDEAAPVAWSSQFAVTLEETGRHDRLAAVLTTSGRPPKAFPMLLKCDECGTNHVETTSRAIQCRHCGSLAIRTEPYELAKAEVS